MEDAGMRTPDLAGSAARRINHRLLAGGLVAALGLVLAIVLAPFIPGLLGAPILSVVFTPLYRRLARRLRPRAAAGLTIAAAIVLVLVPGVAIAALLMREVPRVLAGADLSSLLARLSALEFHGIAIGAGIAALGRAATTWASQQAFAIAGSATRAAVNLVIAFFGLYYLLVSGESAWRAFAMYSPFSRATTERLRVKFRSVTKATLLGIGLGSLVQAVVIGTGFAITGLPDPLLWGAVTGIVSVLPMLGASLVWVSGMIALLAAHRVGAALVLLFIGGVISAHVENFIRPIVSHRVSKIHPLVTLVGAFAGIRYIGLPGVLLGPLALAYFFELLRAFELEFLGTPARAADGLG
jgi:predicted PurR-regulated permease PerM